MRAHWRAEAADNGAAHVHGVLTARDAAMAQRLAPGDTQRIVRALEVLDATGMSLADWQRMPREPVLDLAETIPLVVAVDREELSRRIDLRFLSMMERGALDEVLQLKALDLDPTLPLMTALGVRPLLRHLAGELSRDAADCRRPSGDAASYAKRQVTWAAQ